MGKIGIMGGTFDPIHNGHLLLGIQAYREYGLNQVWYMPSGQPPHKMNLSVTDAACRLEMTRLAVEDHECFICSDFEVERSGLTYTSQTLKLLHEKYPEHTFYFIIGADSLYEIEGWHEPDSVLKQAVILAACREYKESESDLTLDSQIEYLNAKYHSDIRMLHCKEVDISSAELRKMVADGKSITRYVPKAVESYIYSHHLYKGVAECRR